MTIIETMENIIESINSIKDSILKFVPARYIYLYGSYAYGEPTAESDIDIFVITPDDGKRILDLIVEIRLDLVKKNMFFIDLLVSTESDFNDRKDKYLLEKTILQKGKLIYECA